MLRVILLTGLWLAGVGEPQAERPADLMAAAKRTGESVALENEHVRVWRHALEYPSADRRVSESRPVVLYVRVETGAQPAQTALLDRPPGARLLWQPGVMPLGVLVEVRKPPPSTSALRNPESDPPPGTSTRAAWDGGRLVEAVFQPMHVGDGVGPWPTVAVVLSDGVLDVAHNGVRRRVGVRAGDVYWLDARTSLTVVSDHPVGIALVQIEPARSRRALAPAHLTGAVLRAYARTQLTCVRRGPMMGPC